MLPTLAQAGPTVAPFQGQPVLTADDSTDVDGGAKLAQEEEKPTGPRKFWLVAKRSLELLRRG